MKSQKLNFVTAVAAATLMTCSFALAGEVEGPIVKGEVNHGLSRPMRELAPVRSAANAIKPPVTSTGLLNFDGQGAGPGQLYPDANGAVGITQYVQLVNSAYTIYDKTAGTVIAGPILENALWATFGSSCQTTNSGDGTVDYDQSANVWILSHHAVPTGGPYLNCIAVSTSSDATGTYNLYAFQLTLEFPDKPKIGVWPDAYYLSQDVLDPTSKGFVRSQACALDRSAMLAGTFANSICFQGSISLPTFVTTTWVGQTPPPTGEQAFFWQLDQRPNAGKNNLNSFLFHVDWVTATNSTFTGPVLNALPAYTDACANFKPCVPEADTTNIVQGWGDRLMHSIMYRNFGSHESIVMTHAVTVGTGTTARSGIRWYEYRTPLTPVIYQSGTFVPDSSYRWVPSIAMDQFGEIALGYNASSATLHPAVRYTGWRPTIDFKGKMEAETSLIEGTGSQQPKNANWSSFTSMSVDPVDDCTFWYTAPYYKADSISTWSTRIASFRLPSCTN